MTSCFQTLDNNCLQACIASIFDLPLEAAPHVFANGGGWTNAKWARLTDWARTRDYDLVWIEADNREAAALKQSSGHYIAVFYTLDGGAHAVVMRRGKVVFDPAWGGAGITGKPRHYFVFKRRGGLTPAVRTELERWLGPLLPT